MVEFGNRFPHLCENFLSSHNFVESVTLHIGRTGFPVGHFSKLKQTPPKFTPKFPVRNCHGGPQLEKHPPRLRVFCQQDDTCVRFHTL